MIKDFTLESYLNIDIGSLDKANAANKIIDTLAKRSTISYNTKNLKNQLKETREILISELKTMNTTADMYCVSQGIDIENFDKFLLEKIKSNLLFDTIIYEVAKCESIAVEQKDIDEYIRNYRETFGQIQRSTPAELEQDRNKAILTKKVISRLLQLNK